jgi:coproporphyrinogen III oxidase
MPRPSPRILAIKERPASMGLILIAAGISQLEPWIEPLVGAELEARIAASWPGPVTWVLPAQPWVPDWVHGGRGSLAVRVTAHAQSAALCRAAGFAIVSTSANRSGRPPARTGIQVRRWFGGELDLILGGATGGLDRPSEIRDASAAGGFGPPDSASGRATGATMQHHRTSTEIRAVEDWLRSLHDELTGELESLDGGARFRSDAWERPEGGGGDSRVIEEGALFEKGGINFSARSRRALPPSATARRPELAGRSFRATGVSMVLHPRNPYVPTTHGNWRFFVAEKPGEAPVWWFGGGFDLTPYYPYLEDVQHWHEQARAMPACRLATTSIRSTSAGPMSISTCAHRNEPRGVGGLFYDDLNDWGFDRCFEFSRSVADHFLPAYAPIVTRRRHTPWGDREREFQLYRSGRYVEFNLVYDRGTLFGLQSGGRIESILMSLPPWCGGVTTGRPADGTPEAALYRIS